MRRISRTGALLCTLILLASPAAFGQAADQEPTLSTNRPNQTESPDPAPPGYLLFEVGWQVSEIDEGFFELRTHEFPASVIRLGWAPRLEVSFSWSGVAWSEFEELGFEQDERAIQDGGLAAKVRLWGEDGLLPRSSVRAGVNLPFGEDGFSSGRADPFVSFLATHTLNDRIALNYNLGPSWSTTQDAAGDRDTLASFNYIVSTDFTLDDPLLLSFEFFGSTGLNARSRARNSFDVSLGYRLRNSVIIDILAGRGLSETTPDCFLASGLTFQLPYR